MTAEFHSKQENNPSRTFIFGFLAILGTVLFYFLGYEPLTKIIQARTWSPILTKVESNSLIEGVVRTKDGTHKIYKVNIQYAYQYDGKWYKGNQYNFNSFYTSDIKRLQNILADYPVGKKFICYVDSKDPSRSVIQRDVGWYLLPGVMSFILIGIGLAGLCVHVRTNDDDASRNLHKAHPIKDKNFEISYLHTNPEMKPQNNDVIASLQTKRLENKQLPK